MEEKPQSIWRGFAIGLVILGLVLHAYVALSPANSLLNWYTTDDAFYYYQVAVNVTGGNGVTFDGINPTNGFQPLWMLVCIPVFALARFNLLLPLRLLVMVSAAFSIGTGLLLFRMLRRFISTGVAAVIVVVWLFLPSIHGDVVMQGMEAVTSAFFLVWLLSLAVQWRGERLPASRVALLGLVAGLAILARLDNIFVVLLLGVWFILGFAGPFARNLAVGDLALVFIAGLLSYFIRLRAGPFYQTYAYSLPWLLGLGFLLKPLLLYLFGLYRPQAARQPLRFLLRGGLAVTLAEGVIGGVLLGLQGLHVFPAEPRAMLILGQIIIIDWTGTLLGALGLRLFVRGFTAGAAEGDLAPDLRSASFWTPVLRSAPGFLLPLAGLLGGYLAWSYAYTGAWMPVSAQIKHWWSGLRNVVYGTVVHTAPELFGVQGRYNAWELAASPFTFIVETTQKILNPGAARVVSMLLVALLVLGIVVILISRRRWIAGLLDQMGLFPFFLALYCHIFYYTATSYIHIRPWYWVGEMVFTMLLLGVLLESVRQGLERRQPRPRLWAAFMALVGVAVLVSFGARLLHFFPYQISPEHREAYLAETRFLEAHTEPGALIGMTGGGTTAYFLQGRTITNMDGLINCPDYFEFLSGGQAARFWDALGLDYVYGRTYMFLESDPYQEIFSGRLVEVEHFEFQVLYRYLPAEEER
ncbi:MAG: hypothetical protein JXB85_05965 [Anaerolineales bacterium]|nr:hypothetical protein [Anaerolineales bacterium]